VRVMASGDSLAFGEGLRLDRPGTAQLRARSPTIRDSPSRSGSLGRGTL
jgi:hypothetical protein